MTTNANPKLAIENFMLDIWFFDVKEGIKNAKEERLCQGLPNVYMKCKV